ncbi:MAG: Na+/H+ antiporter subunit E [Parasporobacterium sp.]|nr:Na+/H+ antiporter subunit E [Parasporobacterium sp.]
MKKITPAAFFSTLIVCYLFWLLITGQIVSIFTGDASWQILVAGGVVSILVSLFAARFFIHEKAFRLFNPVRFFLLLFYVIIIFGWELIKANVSMAIRAFCPTKKLKPGFVKIPTKLKSEYALSMLANSITLTPGTITMDIVEQDGENYLYVHCIDAEAEDMEKAGEEVKGAMEKWIRRIWE